MLRTPHVRLVRSITVANYARGKTHSLVLAGRKTSVEKSPEIEIRSRYNNLSISRTPGCHASYKLIYVMYEKSGAI